MLESLYRNRSKYKSLESRMTRKCHVRFGGGLLEKEPQGYLVSSLPYNELAGPEMEGLQLFPAESRLVDGANQYHVWILKGSKVPIGFAERLVSEGDCGIGVDQRPFEDDSRPQDLADIRFRRLPLASIPTARSHRSEKLRP